MAARKVFGRVELEADGHKYIFELTKQGLRVKEKRKHASVLVRAKTLSRLMQPQMEFFAITKPKEKTPEGERAIAELKEVHAELSLMTGAATDGLNWRSMLQIIYNQLKGQSEIPINTNVPNPEPGPVPKAEVPTDGHEGG